MKFSAIAIFLPAVMAAALPAEQPATLAAQRMCTCQRPDGSVSGRGLCYWGNGRLVGPGGEWCTNTTRGPLEQIYTDAVCNQSSIGPSGTRAVCQDM